MTDDELTKVKSDLLLQIADLTAPPNVNLNISLSVLAALIARADRVNSLSQSLSESEARVRKCSDTCSELRSKNDLLTGTALSMDARCAKAERDLAALRASLSPGGEAAQ